MTTAPTVARRSNTLFRTDAVAYAILIGCVVALMRSSGRIRASDAYRSFLGVAGAASLVLYAVYASTNPSSNYSLK